jgi:two-component system NtrC family sensor kinase
MSDLTTDHTEEIRTILEAAPFPLIISRYADGRVAYANEHAASLLGLSARELIGTLGSDLYADPEDRKALLRELAEKGRVSAYELRMRDPEGRERWAIFSVAIATLGGEKVLVSGLAEITERKEAERALSASEEKFRSLVENANDLIYMLTPEGIFSYVSPNWPEILGQEVSEVLGKSFAPLVHPDDLEACYAFLAKVVETGEKQSGIEYRVKHADGSWRWHTSNASCLKSADGSVQWFLGIARDITEKKRSQHVLEQALRDLRATQAQLVQAEKMAALSNMVAAVAHELNSPIGAINSVQSTLATAVARLRRELATSGSDEKLGPLLDAIRDADAVIATGAARITEIVRRLRTFVRLDEAEVKSVDLHDGIESTLSLLQHELGSDIAVERDYGSLPKVVCHPAKLNHVFLNILTNAIQVLRGTGTIAIRTFVEGEMACVAIRDTGPGISGRDLKSLFDPAFVRMGDRIGAGLGLPICQQIVQQHGGELTVESRPGEGSTFTIKVPLRPARRA